MMQTLIERYVTDHMSVSTAKYRKIKTLRVLFM